MANKPMTTAEKLAAARAGAAAKPAESAPASQPAEAEASAPAAHVEAAAAPTPASLGRPLTLAEKLAAARAGGAPKPAAAPAAKAVASSPAAESAPAAPACPPPDIPTPEKLGRPLTIAEKLAAARMMSGSAPAAGAKPAAKPAAAGAPKAAAAAKPAARELPPLDKISDPKDLAEALRQTAQKKIAESAPPPPAAKAGAKAKDAKPQTVPPKPSKGLLSKLTRRDVTIHIPANLAWVIAGWVAFNAGMTALTVMTVRFLFPNVLAEPPSTVKIGYPTDYEKEDVNERFKAEWGFWVVRSTKVNGVDEIYALQSICTHLGCPPNWLAAEQKFKCPCHGSGFYISGINFEGPAPRPLERFKVTVADDGQIVVDKSQKFQQELGQWSDPDSFIVA